MKFSAVALVLIFLLVATVGFAMMCQDMGMDGAMMAVYHISIYQSFTNVTVASFVSLLALFVLAFTAFLSVVVGSLPSSQPFFNTRFDWLAPDIIAISKRKITHFLALLENSPSLA